MLEGEGKDGDSKNAVKFACDSSAFWRSPSLGSLSRALGGSGGGLMGPHRALDKSMRNRNSVDGPRNTGTVKSLSLR